MCVTARGRKRLRVRCEVAQPFPGIQNVNKASSVRGVCCASWFKILELKPKKSKLSPSCSTSRQRPLSGELDQTSSLYFTCKNGANLSGMSTMA